jgi:hypothetical protein
MMKAIATLAFLTIGFGTPAFAEDGQSAASSTDPSQVVSPTTRFDFDDDQVEGDIQRPDGELVTSIEQAKEESLIDIRRNFVPEIVKMIEDL